jgi:Flp pilus assembly pilin Flp
MPRNPLDWFVAQAHNPVSPMNRVANIYSKNEIATKSMNSNGGEPMNARKMKNGQSMTEYLLIVAAIAVTIMGGFNMVGQASKSMVNQAAGELHASSSPVVAAGRYA